MTTKVEREDPSTPSISTSVMLPRIGLTSTLMGGTESMRQAAQTYLPQHEREDDAVYDERLSTASLFNGFKKSVRSLAGKPFKKPMQFGDNFPTELKNLNGDIDLLGNNIDTFARESFIDGMQKGMTAVFVDFPEVPQGASLADERDMGARPYFVQMPRENIIAATARMIDGIEVLDHLRIFETSIERDGFAEVEKVFIREYNLVMFDGEAGGDPELGVEWSKWARPNSRSKKWERVEGPNRLGTMKFIPLAVWYLEREDFMVARPPLEDLAHINITHWQSSSDQRMILTVARFPILAGRGVSNDTINAGPKSFLRSSDPQSLFYYVEHTGAAINSGKVDLDDLKADMAAMGADMLVRKPGNMTATEKSIDSADEVSDLQAFCMTFEGMMEQAYTFAGMWLNMDIDDPEAMVQIDKLFGPTDKQQAKLEALLKAREKGDISRRRFLIEMDRLDVFSEDFDLETEIDEQDKEREDAAAMFGSEFANGNPDPKDDPNEDLTGDPPPNDD